MSKARSIDSHLTCFPLVRGPCGGRCGIRTHGDPEATTAFEAAPFDRSGNLPGSRLAGWGAGHDAFPPACYQVAMAPSPTPPGPGELMAGLRRALEAAADPAQAPAMTAYMKHQFPFLGIAAPARRAAQKPTLDALTGAPGDLLIAFADACWAEPEREFQYSAADALRRHAQALAPDHLPALANLITTRSWWDTVDALATHPVGSLVSRHPTLATEMDAWARSDNLWLARTAILHQLLYKQRTDADRLFAYADLRAADTDFFIRKALGWALRQYARTAPDAVRTYVASRADRLSPLTAREALKHL